MFIYLHCYHHQLNELSKYIMLFINIDSPTERWLNCAFISHHATHRGYDVIDLIAPGLFITLL